MCSGCFNDSVRNTLQFITSKAASPLKTAEFVDFGAFFFWSGRGGGLSTALAPLENQENCQNLGGDSQGEKIFAQGLYISVSASIPIYLSIYLSTYLSIYIWQVMSATTLQSKV